MTLNISRFKPMYTIMQYKGLFINVIVSVTSTIVYWQIAVRYCPIVNIT